MIAEHQRDALHDREVALEDRVDHQLADAGQREHLLDDERAADQEADVHAEHADGRDDARFAARGGCSDAPLGDALRAGGGDVVRLEHLQQARPQAADQDRRDPQGDGERRQEHRVQVADAARAVSADRELAGPGAGRTPSRSMIPSQNGGKPRPTSGTARTTWSRMPSLRVAASVASGHRDQDREHRAVADQPQRHRQPARDQRPGRHVVEQRLAQVAVQQPLHEQLVLRRQRLVEAPLVMQQRRSASGVACTPSIVRAGSPGTRWIMKNTSSGDAEHDRDRLHEPAQDVCEPVHGRVFCAALRSPASARARRPPCGSCRSGRRRSRAPCSSTHTRTGSSTGTP